MYRYCDLCEEWIHSDRHIIGRNSRLVKCGICGYPLRRKLTDDQHNELLAKYQGNIPEPKRRHLGS